MAASVTVTVSPRKSKYEGLFEQQSVAWTSDASGDASGTLIAHGWLVKMITNPDGTNIPTDNYDITLVDENGIDALEGSGANLDTAVTEVSYPTGGVLPVFLCGSHTFTVAAAGNGKSGVCVFYIVESL